MNKVGMLIDVSHCGQQTAYDAVMYSKKPIIMQPRGRQAAYGTLSAWPAMISLKPSVAKGGVVGIESAPHTTMSKTKMTHDLDSVMEHFEYVKNLIGIDHVGPLAWTACTATMWAYTTPLPPHLSTSGN